MARILVAEKIAEPALQRMRDAGHEVDIQVGLSPEELIEAVVGAQALIIRSATTVTAQVINSGKDLVLVGRAGVGLDNVDVAAATEAGVLVANAPLSNVVSAAEQTLALILATARNLPQAHSALTQGRWERSAWSGVELQGKTLAIVGLGRIGRLVATRAAAFDMRLIGYDPYVTQESAAEAGVELVSLDEIAARADFLTLHVAKTPDTTNLIDAAFLAKAKATLRVINVARGGIVNEADLAEAIASGQIAGAGIDVWETEPTTESPLFALPSVVVAPHLGASTAEAQDKAGDAIADQVLAALSGKPVEFAVNA
ncbi:MAG: hydroxyacid dehydrogenase [Acidimicrobiales bacterium]|jgi:D-3-phosphoglycerate dehydrogenase / 2-oxoglutarate reductase